MSHINGLFSISNNSVTPVTNLSSSEPLPLKQNQFTSEDTAIPSSLPTSPDLICLSHLRWDFVYQRPQHLLSRCVQTRRVFFVEEPIYEASEETGYLEVNQADCGVWVIRPHLPPNLDADAIATVQRTLIDELMVNYSITAPILWYYTPMALSFTNHLQPLAVVYDCMDELSAFRGAPQCLRDREQELFQAADLVFTGGQSLYEVKRHQHPHAYAFPSSIDAAHFNQARQVTLDPADQANIPHPRLGFYGVIDERMDLELLAGIATARPDWHLVIVGPVVKIDSASLPAQPNIHYLGGKSYQELPQYLAGWDVAMMPFARNESTRFISPTKTPEYLAAAKPVVSTSIQDVVCPYGEKGLVYIADTVEAFVAAAESAMAQVESNQDWLQQVDDFLAQTSWDKTWAAMLHLVDAVIGQKQSQHQPHAESGVTHRKQSTTVKQPAIPSMSSLQTATSLQELHS